VSGWRFGPGAIHANCRRLAPESEAFLQQFANQSKLSSVSGPNLDWFAEIPRPAERDRSVLVPSVMLFGAAQRRGAARTTNATARGR
jgi:hypothetical protein